MLREFLISLAELDTSGLSVDHLFIDDNPEDQSSELLRSFRTEGKSLVIRAGTQGEYQRDEVTHRWREDLIWKVAGFKDVILRHALEKGYDYAFLVDSDLVLAPPTLKQLLAAEKAIVAEVFWTRWTPGSPELPQVWLRDQYDLVPRRREEQLSQTEADQRVRQFLELLRKPGLYEVGGLGACTLISRQALAAGVSFKEVPNVSFWGEDRHFCIRAAALGFGLFVDTHHPAYHIYRLSDLGGVPGYKAQSAAPEARPVSGGGGPRADFVERQHLVQLAEEIIEAFGTSDYRDSPNTTWAEYFLPERRKALIEAALSATLEAKEKKTISLARVGRSRMVEIGPKEILVECEVISEGTERRRPFREQFLGRVLAVRQTDEWKIAEMSFEEQRSQAVPEVAAARPSGSGITLSMLVRNEADRYLPLVLAHARRYVDAAVILDDASDDGTPDLCREILEGIPTTIVSNKTPSFGNEIKLRKQQWQLTVDSGAELILNLDADEVFEDRAVTELASLTQNPDLDYWAFSLYDLWDLRHYREDPHWQAHRFPRIFLVRYRPRFGYKWRETPQHCGRFPMNIGDSRGKISDLRLKHLGWASAADRVHKYRRYKELDPAGRWGDKAQYESILDRNPRLIKFV